MELLRVKELTKRYAAFTLDRVSFSLEEGYIMGFIGRNGAGKTTTLKSMLGLVRPDGGSVEMFGRPFAENELYCKQQLGFVLGEVDYYASKRLKDVADVTSRFYESWDRDAYGRCLTAFSLDPNKRIKELSAGMKVKFSLAMALSHHARLLILDEPTSGLDPVSRDELLDIFLDTVSDGTRSILFSTHIITDLEKCADSITYIKDGRILTSQAKDDFTQSYRLVAGGLEQLTPALREKLIGCRSHQFGFEAMMTAADAAACPALQVSPAGLEEIMVHIERSGAHEESHL